MNSDHWFQGPSAALQDCCEANTDGEECEIPSRSLAARGLHTLGKLQLLIVEDFEPFSAYLCGILSRLGFTNVAQARDGEQAIELAQKLQPDVVLLDLGLPKVSGLEVARRLRAISPRSQLLIVSSETSMEIVEEAMAAGARGYVFKYCASADVAPAIGAILNGEKFVSAKSI